MAFLSELIGQTVWDARGERVGRCADILIVHPDQPFPTVRALALEDGEGAGQFIPAEQIGWLGPNILLKVSRSHLKPFTPQGNELWLVRQILDRQIVDTEGRRVVRVNDLLLTRTNEHFCLAGVDVGGLGLLRRLGIQKPALTLFSILRQKPPELIIPWEDVAPLQAQEPIRLRISRDKIGRIHPSDIADIIADLDRRTGQALIESLDDEVAADTIEEIPPQMQVDVISRLEPERAADILEEMGPDEAADLLGDLPAHASQKLLELMEDEDAEDVRRLLAYPEDSAGGIMTTEFTTLPEGLTVAQALEYLRQSEEAQEDEALHYIYVVDEGGHLKGVISLRDLVLSPPEATLTERMTTRLITVGPLTPQQEIARLIAKYNLLAVPVVDEAGVLQGIVTVDDAIDAILPTAWKKRLPRFFYV